jgi:hypothetical protein
MPKLKRPAAVLGKPAASLKKPAAAGPLVAPDGPLLEKPHVEKMLVPRGSPRAMQIIDGKFGYLVRDQSIYGAKFYPDDKQHLQDLLHHQEPPLQAGEGSSSSSSSSDSTYSNMGQFMGYMVSIPRHALKKVMEVLRECDQPEDMADQCDIEAEDECIDA